MLWGPEFVQAIITVVLSAGGAAFIGQIFKGWKTLRTGARAHEREAVQDLAKARDMADERARVAEDDRDFWRRTSARYAGQLLRAGIDPVPADPIPPSEQPKPPKRRWP